VIDFQRRRIPRNREDGIEVEPIRELQQIPLDLLRGVVLLRRNQSEVALGQRIDRAL